MPEDRLILLDGSTFFYSDASGDVDATAAEGFFRADMRHLSRWRLLVDGEPLHVLTSRRVDYYSARVVAVPASQRDDPDPAIVVCRDRFVARGVHEDVRLENNGARPRRLQLEICFGSDFADILECKGNADKRGTIRTELDGRRAGLWYERDGYRRGTVVEFSQPFELEDDRARFELELEPKGSWSTCIDLVPVVDGEPVPPERRCDSFGQAVPDMPMSLDEWFEDAPALDADWDPLRHIYRQSLLDLASLRFRTSDELDWSLPAGGAPWFMALFGRDSIISAYQSLPFQPHLAETTLEVLADLQATHDDAFRDAEPGKILHELRLGELAVLGDEPHGPYYGAHDTTPLFLVLLDEYERWSGDVDLVRRLEPNARAALAWIEGAGDLDGDGYLEYRSRSPKGLDNHGWKDADNAILFGDGRRAEPPIALCEIQGYAYDARLRLARLARRVYGDDGLAERLERDAAALRERFDRDFWLPELGCFALALDGEKRKVDSVASNVGHLLWSGILFEDKAKLIVERLLGDDMFSGWGIRTMSSREAGYNPLGYHVGTVWPHDNALIAEGMRRYGFHAEAARVLEALLEAADAFGYQLPELFGGFARDDAEVPVEYVHSSRPQAFAAGAPLLALRTMLGLDAEDGKLRVRSHVPERIGRVRLRGVHVGGGRTDAKT